MTGITKEATTERRGRKESKGRLAEWIDDKGYGWIAAGGRRVFAHIKEFERGQRRPVAGDEVTFSAGTDGQGRACAKEIRLVIQTARIGAGAWVLLALLLVPPIAGGIHDGLPWWVVPAWYAVASVVAWSLYASDKRRAREGRWRVKETTLHLVEMLGGWPGAFLAQRRFRHKTVKRSFQSGFWFAVVLHQFIAIDELSNSAGIDAIWEWGVETWRGMVEVPGDFSQNCGVRCGSISLRSVVISDQWDTGRGGFMDE